MSSGPPARTTRSASGAARSPLAISIEIMRPPLIRPRWPCATPGLAGLGAPRGNLAPAAVGAYIGSAYFFTSSTSFANPAIDIGRMFSDTFAGIAPASVPAFIVFQLIGGAVAIAVIRTLYPDLTAEEAAEILLPHDSDGTDPARAAARDASSHH
jgi:hypothetical protein